jgi:hypothetical protein
MQETICLDCDDEVQQKWEAYKPEEYVLLEGIYNFSRFSGTNSKKRHTKLMEFIYAKTSINMLKKSGYEKGKLFREHFEVVDEVKSKIFKTCICSQYNIYDDTLHSYVIKCIKNDIRFRVGCICFKNLIGLQTKDKDGITFEEHAEWVAKNQKSKICLICNELIKRTHYTRPNLCSMKCRLEKEKIEKIEKRKTEREESQRVKYEEKKIQLEKREKEENFFDDMICKYAGISRDTHIIPGLCKIKVSAEVKKQIEAIAKTCQQK